jgi:hypothetical protein
MKKAIILHPFLFAIFPILFLIAYNIRESSFIEILIPSAAVIGFTLLLLLFGWLIFKKNIRKSAILVSIFLILFFSYGRIYEIIQGFQIGPFVIGRHRYLWILWFIIFALCFYFIIKTKSDLYNFTNILNVMAVVLIIISLVNIGVYKIKTRNIWVIGSGEEISLSQERKEEENQYLNNSIPPDIYYIILDGYARSDVLYEFFGYDNNDFDQKLKERGFFIARDSYCNYAQTFLSLPSSLNMEYINDLADVVGEESDDMSLLIQKIQNNKVMNLLKSEGYLFIFSSSGGGATDHNKYADLELRHGGINEFITLLIKTSMLNYFEDYLIKNPGRERILDSFEQLAKVPEIKGQKFVFSHIISPHPPYLFDREGDPVPEGDEEIGMFRWKRKEDYINQLIFINKKTIALIDEILLKSERPPIIIIQADHGSASTFDYKVPGGVWENPTEEMLKERMSILNAYHLPDGGNSLLYDSITPVNTFRIIFNHYFGSDYELLDDRAYYSSYLTPYKFIDVTDIVTSN